VPVTRANERIKYVSLIDGDVQSRKDMPKKALGRHLRYFKRPTRVRQL
jgi:hypothetical protein